MHLDLSQTTGVECSNCHGIFFKQSVLIRKISKFLTGEPEDRIIPMVIFRCDDCGEVFKDQFPSGMPDVEAKLGLTKEEPILDRRSPLTFDIG